MYLAMIIIKNIWLIDRLLLYVPLVNISLTNRKLAIADDKLQTGIICSALMTLSLYNVADRDFLLWHETSVLYGPPHSDVSYYKQGTL